MNPMAIFLFSGLLLAELIGEYTATARTGTLRRADRREWTYFTMALPFKAMLIASLAEAILSTGPVTLTAMISGSLLTAIGISIRIKGHMTLDGAFSPYVQTTATQRLVRSGMYSRIRHPMYLGSIFLFVGFPLIVSATWAWIFTVLGMAGILIRIRKEETHMKSALAGYGDYMKSTWRLIPYVY